MPVALSLAGFLAGCTQASAPITIGKALREVQNQLRDAGAVSAVGTDPARFAQAVRQQQCAAGQADPEVAFLAHEVEIDLSGSFTASGGFTVGPPISAASLSASASRSQTQQITLPISFVSLSEVPALSTSQRLAPLSLLPPAVQRSETAAILADRDALRERITALIAGWTPTACPAHPGGTLIQPNIRKSAQTAP